MLRVEALHAGYGERAVLHGVSLQVRPGEVQALVGPNGCGKTTLLKAITKLVPLTAGRVFVGEADIARLSPQAISRLVAVVPQNSVLPLGYTALEVVLMGRTPHLGLFQQEGPRDMETAAAALDRVGAGHLSARRVDELSGGERQNVVIARALAQEAPVLLLDEPTANLDVGHQIAVARLLRDLAASGLAVLAAVHDLTLASLYSDKIALMGEGCMAQVGTPEEVLTESAIRDLYGADVTVLTGILRRPVIVPLGSQDC